jgi:hypothetical protein
LLALSYPGLVLYSMYIIYRIQSQPPELDL